ncbi:sodium/calcium exchanger protein [Isoptericola sp. NPDC019482]|uniref:sodium/calcium exchanger protein n=1 Tax=Isoptericola sp. NPDC019482 TaxID=3154688 RepID=UPI00346F3B3B
MTVDAVAGVLGATVRSTVPTAGNAWRMAYSAAAAAWSAGRDGGAGGKVQAGLDDEAVAGPAQPDVRGLFVLAAAVILACAEPFAESLVASGSQLGIDEFLLVQWLAPLASEAPEFIIAVLFAWRGKGTAAIATLISSKINQWTLLVGSLPIAYLAGGGTASLVLDTRQVEEVLLTATQTMMGVAILLGLRFHRWSAWTLLGLFVIQFAVTGTTGRFVLSGIYAAISVAILIVQRRHIIPTLTAPFRTNTE